MTQTSKKLYKKFADEISRIDNEQERLDFYNVCAKLFREDNDRFDHIKFYRACGFEYMV